MLTGIQISSLKKYIQTVPCLDDTLRRLSEMGYNQVQLQWTGEEVRYPDIKRLMDKYGFGCWGTQDYFDIVMGRFDYELEAAQAYGASYICVSGIPERYMSLEGIARMADELNEAQRKAQQVGAIMTFHPRGQEFALIDGIPATDRLLALTPGVQLTLDVWNVMMGGQDVFETLKRYSGRCDLVHLKTGQELRADTQLMPIGEGVVDFPPIIEACKQAGVRIAFVEQEKWAKDAFECMEQSLRYVEKYI